MGEGAASRGECVALANDELMKYTTITKQRRRARAHALTRLQGAHAGR